MDRWLFFVLLAASWTLSAVLIFRLWTRDYGLADRIGGTVLLLVPIVGPLLYWFVYNSLVPQPAHLQAHGPRGTYTHKWLALRPVLKQALGERRAQDEQPKEDSSK